MIYEQMPWVEQAACRGRHDLNWLPERGESLREQKAVCCDCPAKSDCLDYALRHNEPGVYGGTSERDRRNIRREKSRMATNARFGA